MEAGHVAPPKTSAGNLFMALGEPDVEIRRTEDNHVVIEIRGVDVYDPTTGQVCSSTTDDIACWFLDTNYNEESFFARARPTSPGPVTHMARFAKRSE